MSNWTVTDLSGNIIREGFDSVYISDDGVVIEPDPKPDIPWPCWDEHPISPEACMEAVRSFSRSGK
jgi:hypothetical protein